MRRWVWALSPVPRQVQYERIAFAPRGNVPPSRGLDPPPSARIVPVHPPHHPGPLPGRQMPSPLSPGPELPGTSNLLDALFESHTYPCYAPMARCRAAPMVPARNHLPQLRNRDPSWPLGHHLPRLLASLASGTHPSRRRQGGDAAMTPPPSLLLVARTIPVNVI